MAAGVGIGPWSSLGLFQVKIKARHDGSAMRHWKCPQNRLPREVNLATFLSAHFGDVSIRGS